MSTDSLIYLSVSGVLLVAGLGFAGALYQMDRESGQVILAVAGACAAALLWPFAALVLVLSLPFCVGRVLGWALERRHDRRMRARQCAEGEARRVIAQMRNLQMEFAHGSPVHEIVGHHIEKMEQAL